MVDCECEASRSSRNPMLQCDICSNYKHSECYGYLGTRLYPMDFACYTCLQSFDKDLLKNMQSVCVKRRVLNFLQQGGNATELGELINKDDSSVLRILGEWVVSIAHVRRLYIINISGWVILATWANWSVRLSTEGCIALNKRRVKGEGKAGEEADVRFIGNGDYFQPHKDIQHLVRLRFPRVVILLNY